MARARGAGADQIGVMYTLSGAGGLVGAILTPAIGRVLAPAQILVATSAVDGLACLALYPTTSPYLMGLIGAAAFLLAPAANAAVYGRLAATVPDGLTAGVNASVTQVIGLFGPFSPIVTGIAADVAGPGDTVLLCSVLFGFLAVTAISVPALRRT